MSNLGFGQSRPEGRTLAAAGFTGVPTPGLFWSAWQLSVPVDAEELPGLAVDWLEQGVVADSVAYLAGLSRAERPSRLRDALETVAAELVLPSVWEEAGRVAVAELVLRAIADETLDPVSGAQLLNTYLRRSYEHQWSTLDWSAVDSVAGLGLLSDEVARAELVRAIRDQARRELVAKDGAATEVAGPVIVDENGDIEVYSDADLACRQLEAIDVDAGEYRAFDSSGREIEMSVVDGSVVMRLMPGSMPDSDAAAARVREVARAIGPDRLGIDDPNSADTNELIQRILEFEPPPFTWRSLLPRRRRRRADSGRDSGPLV